MAVPSSTIRVVTELRIVELLDGLELFSADAGEATDGVFWVTPWGRGQPDARRWLAIGVPLGAIDPDGIQRSTSPTVDSWSISCAVGCTDEDDGPTAKQIVETAVNAVADLLALDHRLGLAPGPRNVQVSATWEGPYFEWDQGKAPFAWANFDITASADIERHQP